MLTRTLADGSKRYDVLWRSNGRQKSKTFKAAKAADRFRADTIKNVHDGTYQEVKPTPMGEVFDRWLSHSLEVRLLEGSLKPSTAKSYRSMLAEHLRPAFAEIRSDRLTLMEIEEWRKGIAAQIGAGTMAAKSYVNLRNLLHGICDWACHPSRAYMVRNPVNGLEKLYLPRAKKRPHFEPEQIETLLKAASATPPDDTIIRLALYSGLRRGELFALQWHDVDEGNGQDGGRLHVRRSIYQGAITTPKTEDSDRAVDIPQELLDDLAVYRVMYPKIGEGFIFRQASGRPLDPDAWHRERMVPILEKAKLRLPMAGLHSLRHTYVSLLINLGEDTRYIADQVGHSTTRLTEDLYAHVFNRVRVDAMRRLGASMPSSKYPTEPAGTASNNRGQQRVSYEEDRPAGTAGNTGAFS